MSSRAARKLNAATAPCTSADVVPVPAADAGELLELERAIEARTRDVGAVQYRIALLVEERAAALKSTHELTTKRDALVRELARRLALDGRYNLEIDPSSKAPCAFRRER